MSQASTSIGPVGLSAPVGAPGNAQQRLQKEIFDKRPAKPPVQGPGSIMIQIRKSGASNHQLSHRVHDILPVAILKEVQFITTADAAQATPCLFRLKIGNVDNILSSKSDPTNGSSLKDQLNGMMAFPLTPTNTGASQVVRIHPDTACGRVVVSRKMPIECCFTDLASTVDIPFATVLGSQGQVIVYLQHSVGDATSKELL